MASLIPMRGVPLDLPILTLEQAVHRFGRENRQAQRVVFTNGCFDLLHPGHIPPRTSSRARRRAHRRPQQRRKRAATKRTRPSRAARTGARRDPRRPRMRRRRGDLRRIRPRAKSSPPCFRTCSSKAATGPTTRSSAATKSKQPVAASSPFPSFPATPRPKSSKDSRSRSPRPARQS